MVDYTLRFGPLAEHSRVVYFAYHVDSQRVAYVSPAYEQIIGGSAGRVNEDLPAWKACIHPDDLEYLSTRFTHVLTGELVQDVELRLLHPTDGRLQWLCITATRVVSPDGATYISGTAHDITAQKAYMDNANKYNAKKNAVLEILAHDLAGPLATVKQLAEHVSEQSLQYKNPALNELVRLMRVTCKNSVELIRDFVDQEFMESSSVQLRRERLDVVTWVRLVVEQYQSADKLQKAFVFHPLAEVAYAHFDLNEFEQVLNNLLSNAIKFTPDGGRIEVSAESAPGLVRVIVADDGIGIPEKLQPLLFDKFTKARRPGLRGEKTTGLGMSVIRTIVELHDGSIRFTSQEGVGSTFIVEIPAAPEESGA